MGLDDFYINEDDRLFFREAANAIYEWLPIDKRVKLGLELASEGKSNIEELKERARFFRLLRFLEVNYIRVVDWSDNTLKLLEKVNQAKESPIEDIELRLFEKEKNSLTKIFKELSETEIRSLFYDTLDKLELSEEYAKYSISLKKVDDNE